MAKWQKHSKQLEALRFSSNSFRQSLFFRSVTLFVLFSFLGQNISFAYAGFAMPVAAKAPSAAKLPSAGFLNKVFHKLSKDVSARDFHEQGVFYSDEGTYIDVSAGTDLTKYDVAAHYDSSAMPVHMYTQSDMTLNMDYSNPQNSYVVSGASSTGVAGQWEVPVVMTTPTTVGSDFAGLPSIPSQEGFDVNDIPGLSGSGFESVTVALNVNWDDGPAAGFQGVAHFDDDNIAQVGGSEMAITNTSIQFKEYLNKDLQKQMAIGGGTSEYWQDIRNKESVLSKYSGNGHNYSLYNTNYDNIARFELNNANQTFSVSGNGARVMIGDRISNQVGTHEASSYDGIGSAADQGQILSGIGVNPLARNISYGTFEGKGNFVVSGLGNVDFDPAAARGSMWGLPGHDNAVQLSENHFYYSATDANTQFIADGNGNNIFSGGVVAAILKDNFTVTDGDKEIIFTAGTGFTGSDNAAIGYMGANSTYSWKGVKEATFTQALFHNKGLHEFENGTTASIFQPLVKTSANDRMSALAPEAQDALANIRTDYLGKYSLDNMVQTEGAAANQPDMDFKQVLASRYTEGVLTAAEDMASFTVQSGERGMHAGWNLHSMNTNVGAGLAYAVNELGHKVDFRGDGLNIETGEIKNHYRFTDSSSWGMGRDVNGNDTAARWTNMTYHAENDATISQNYDMHITGLDQVINRRHEITGLDVTAAFNDYGNINWTVNNLENEVKVISSTLGRENVTATATLTDMNTNGTETLGFKDLRGDLFGFSAETSEMDILTKAAGAVAIDPRLDRAGQAAPAPAPTQPGLIDETSLMSRGNLTAGSLGTLSYLGHTYNADMVSGGMTWDALGTGQSDLGAGLVDVINYNHNRPDLAADQRQANAVNSFVNRTGSNIVDLYGKLNPNQEDSELFKHSSVSGGFTEDLNAYGYAGANGAFVNQMRTYDVDLYQTGDYRRSDVAGYILGPQADQANRFVMIPDLMGDKVFLGGENVDGSLHFDWNSEHGRLMATSAGAEQYLINPETEIYKVTNRTMAESFAHSLSQQNLTTAQKNHIKNLSADILNGLEDTYTSRERAIDLITRDTTLNLDRGTAQLLVDGALAAQKAGNSSLVVDGEIHGAGAWEIDGQTLNLTAAQTDLDESLRAANPGLLETTANARIRHFAFRATQDPQDGGARMQRTFNHSSRASNSTFKVNVQNTFNNLNTTGGFGLSGTIPYYSKIVSEGGSGKTPDYDGVVDVNALLSPSGRDMSLFNMFTMKNNNGTFAELQISNPDQIESVINQRLSTADTYNIGNRTVGENGMVSFGAAGNGHRALSAGQTITRGDKGQLLYQEGSSMHSLMGELSYKTATVGDANISAWSVYSPTAYFNYVNLNTTDDASKDNFVWKPTEHTLMYNDISAGAATVKKNGETYQIDFDGVRWNDQVGLINSWGGNGYSLETSAAGVVLKKEAVETLPLTVEFTNVYHKTAEQLAAIEAARNASEAQAMAGVGPLRDVESYNNGMPNGALPAMQGAEIPAWMSWFHNDDGPGYFQSVMGYVANAVANAVPHEAANIDHSSYHSIVEYVGLNGEIRDDKAEILINVLGTDAGTGENRRIGFMANVDQVEMKNTVGMAGTRLSIEQGPTVNEVEQVVGSYQSQKNDNHLRNHVIVDTDGTITDIAGGMSERALFDQFLERDVDGTRDLVREAGLTFVDNEGVKRTIFDGAINIDQNHGLLMDHGTGLWENNFVVNVATGTDYETDNFGIFANEHSDAFVEADQFAAKMLLTRAYTTKDHDIYLPSQANVEAGTNELDRLSVQFAEYDSLIGNRSELQRTVFAKAMSKTMNALSDHIAQRQRERGISRSDYRALDILRDEVNQIDGDFFKLDDPKYIEENLTISQRAAIKDYFISTFLNTFASEGGREMTEAQLRAMDDSTFFTSMYQHWQRANASLSEHAQTTGTRNINRNKSLLEQYSDYVGFSDEDRDEEGNPSTANPSVKVSESKQIATLILANGSFGGKDSETPAWFRRTSDGDWDIGEGSASVHGYIDQTVSSEGLGSRENTVSFNKIHFDSTNRRLSSAAITAYGRMWTPETLFSKPQTNLVLVSQEQSNVTTEAAASKETAADDIVTRARAHSRGAIDDGSDGGTADFFIGTSLETESGSDQLVFDLRSGLIPNLNFKADGSELRIGDDDVFWKTEAVFGEATMTEGSFIFSNEISDLDGKRDEAGYGRALGRAGRHDEAERLTDKDYGFTNVRDRSSVLRFEKDDEGNIRPIYNALTELLYEHNSSGRAMHKDSRTGKVTEYGTMNLQMRGLRFPAMDGKSFIGHGGSLEISGNIVDDAGREIAEFVQASSTEQRNQDGRLVGLVTTGLTADLKNMEFETDKEELLNDFAHSAHARKKEYKVIDLGDPNETQSSSGSTNSSGAAAASHHNDSSGSGVGLSAGVVSNLVDMDYASNYDHKVTLRGMHTFEYRGVTKDGIQIKDTLGMNGNTIITTDVQAEAFHNMGHTGAEIFSLAGKDDTEYLFIQGANGAKEMVFLDMQKQSKRQLKRLANEGRYDEIANLDWLTQDEFALRHRNKAANGRDANDRWVRVTQGNREAMVRESELGYGNARVRDGANEVRIHKNNLPSFFEKRERNNRSFDSDSSQTIWDEGATFVMQGASGFRVGLMPEIHAVANGLISEGNNDTPILNWFNRSKEAELLDGSNAPRTVLVESKALPKSWKAQNPDFDKLVTSIGAGDPNPDAGNAYVTRYVSVSDFEKMLNSGSLNGAERAQARAHLAQHRANGQVPMLLRADKIGSAGEKRGMSRGDDVALYDANGREIGSMDGGRFLWLDGDSREAMQDMFQVNKGYDFEKNMNKGLARNNFRLAGGGHTWYIEGHSFERMMYQLWAQSNGDKSVAALASTVLSQNDSAREFKGNALETAGWVVADAGLVVFNAAFNATGVGVAVPDELATAAAVIKTGQVINKLRGVANVTRGWRAVQNARRAAKVINYVHKTVRAANTMGLVVGGWTAGKQVLIDGVSMDNLGSALENGMMAFNKTARTTAMFQGATGAISGLAQAGYLGKAMSFINAHKTASAFIYGGGLAGATAMQRGINPLEETKEFAAHVIAGGLVMAGGMKLNGVLANRFANYSNNFIQTGKAFSIQSGLAASMPGVAHHITDGIRGIESRYTYSSHVGSFFTGMIAGSTLGATGRWIDAMSNAKAGVWKADQIAQGMFYDKLATFAKSPMGVGWVVADLSIDVLNKGRILGHDIDPIYGGMISDTMANGLHQFNNVLGMYFLAKHLARRGASDPNARGDTGSQSWKEFKESVAERYLHDPKAGFSFSNFKKLSVASWTGATTYALAGKGVTQKIFGEEEGEDLHRAISMASLGTLILGPGLTNHNELYNSWFAKSGNVMGANRLALNMIQQGAQLAPRLATFQPLMEGVLKPLVYTAFRDTPLSNWNFGRQAANWVFEMDLVTDDKLAVLDGVSHMSYEQLRTLAQNQGLSINELTPNNNRLSREQYREEVIRGIMEKHGAKGAAYITTAAGLGMNANDRDYNGFLGYYRLQKDIKMNQIAQQMSTASGQERQMLRSMLFESAATDIYTSGFDHLATTAFEGAKTSVTFGPVMHFVKPVLSAGLRTMPILGDVQDFGQIILKDGEIVKRLKLSGGTTSQVRSFVNRRIDSVSQFATFFSEESLREPLTDIYVGSVARSLGGAFRAPQRADFDSEAVYQAELAKNQQWREWFQEAFDGDGDVASAANIINRSTDNLMRRYSQDHSRFHSSDSDFRQSLDQNTSSVVSAESMGIEASFDAGISVNGMSFAVDNNYSGAEGFIAQTAPNTYVIQIEEGRDESEIAVNHSDNSVTLQVSNQFKLQMSGENVSVAREGNRVTVTMDSSSQANVSLNNNEFAPIDLQNDFQRMDITRGRSSENIQVQVVEGLRDNLGQDTHFDIQSGIVYADASLQANEGVMRTAIEQNFNTAQSEFSSAALFDYLGEDFVGIKIGDDFVGYEHIEQYGVDLQSQIVNFHLLTDFQKANFLATLKGIRNEADEIKLVFGNKDVEELQTEIDLDGKAFQELDILRRQMNYNKFTDLDDAYVHLHSDKVNNADRIAAEEFIVGQMDDAQRLDLMLGNDVTRVMGGKTHVFAADQFSSGMSRVLADQSYEETMNLMDLAQTQINQQRKTAMNDLKSSTEFNEASADQKRFMIARINSDHQRKIAAVDLAKYQMYHEVLGDDLGSMTMQDLERTRKVFNAAVDNYGYLAIKDAAAGQDQVAEKHSWWRIDKRFDELEQGMKSAGQAYQDGFDVSYDHETKTVNVAQNNDDVRVYRYRDRDIEQANDQFLTMQQGQYVNMQNVRNNSNANNADFRLNGFDFYRGAEFKRNVSSDFSGDLKAGDSVFFRNQEFVLSSDIQHLEDLQQELNPDAANGSKWFGEGHDSLTFEVQPDGQLRVKGTIEINDPTNSETKFKKKVHVDQILKNGLKDFKQFETEDENGEIIESGFKFVQGSPVNPLDNDRFELTTKEGTYAISLGWMGEKAPKVKYVSNDGKKETVQLQKAEDMFYVKLGESKDGTDYHGITKSELENNSYIDTVYNGKAYRLDLDYDHSRSTGDNYNVNVSSFEVQGVMSDSTKMFTVDQALDLVNNPAEIAAMYENAADVEANISKLDLEDIKKQIEEIKFDDSLTDKDKRYDELMEVFTPVIEAIVEPQIRAYENLHNDNMYGDQTTLDSIKFKRVSIKPRGSITGPGGNAVAAQVQGSTLAIDASFFVMDTTKDGKLKFDLDLGSVYNAGAGGHEIQHNNINEVSRMYKQVKDRVYNSRGIQTVTSDVLESQKRTASLGENYTPKTEKELESVKENEKKSIDDMGEIQVSDDTRKVQLEANVNTAEAAFDHLVKQLEQNYANGQAMNSFEMEDVITEFLATKNCEPTVFDPGETFDMFMTEQRSMNANDRWIHKDNSSNGSGYEHQRLTDGAVVNADYGVTNKIATEGGIVEMASDITTPAMAADVNNEASMERYERVNKAYKVTRDALNQMASLSVDGKTEEEVYQVLRMFFEMSGINPSNSFRVELHRAHGIGAAEDRPEGPGHAGIKKTGDTFKEGEIIAREITVTDIESGVMFRLERPAIVGKEETKLLGNMPENLPIINVKAQEQAPLQTIAEYNVNNERTIQQEARQGILEELDKLEAHLPEEKRRTKKAILAIAKMLGKNVEDLDFEKGEMKENELLVRYLSLVDTLDPMLENREMMFIDGEKYADTAQGGATFSMLGRVFGMDHTDMIDILALYKSMNMEELLERIYADVGVNWEISVSEASKQSLVKNFNKILKDNEIRFAAYGAAELKTYQEKARSKGSLNYDSDFFIENTEDGKTVVHLNPKTLTKNSVVTKKDENFSQINTTNMKNDGVELETLIKTLYLNIADKSEEDFADEYSQLMEKAEARNSNRLVQALETFAAEKTENENPLTKYLLALKNGFTEAEHAADELASLITEIERDVYVVEEKAELLKKLYKLWDKTVKDDSAQGGLLNNISRVWDNVRKYNFINELELLQNYEIELSDAEQMRLLQQELLVHQILPDQGKQRNAKAFNTNNLVTLLKDNGLFAGLVRDYAELLDKQEEDTESSAVQTFDGREKVEKKDKVDNHTVAPDKEDLIEKSIDNLRKYIKVAETRKLNREERQEIDSAVELGLIESSQATKLKAISPQLYNLSVMQNAINAINTDLETKEAEMKIEEEKALEMAAVKTAASSVEVVEKAAEQVEPVVTTEELVQEEVVEQKVEEKVEQPIVEDAAVEQTGQGGGSTETVGQAGGGTETINGGSGSLSSNVAADFALANKVEQAATFDDALELMVKDLGIEKQERKARSIIESVKATRIDVPRTGDYAAIGAGFNTAAFDHSAKAVFSLNPNARAALAKQIGRSSNPGSCVRSTSMIIDVFGVIIEIRFLPPISHITGIFVNRYGPPATEIVIKSKDGLTQAQFLSTLTAVQLVQAMANSFTDSMLFGYHAAKDPANRPESVNKAMDTYNDTAVKGMLPTLLTIVSVVNQFSEQGVGTTAKFNKMFGFGYGKGQENKTSKEAELVIKEKFESVDEAHKQWEELYALQIIENAKAKATASTAADVDNDEYIEKISSGLTMTAQAYFRMGGSSSRLRESMRKVREEARAKAAEIIEAMKKVAEAPNLPTDNKPVHSGLPIEPIFFLLDKIRDPMSLLPARFRGQTPQVQPKPVPMGKANDVKPSKLKIVKSR